MRKVCLGVFLLSLSIPLIAASDDTNSPPSPPAHIMMAPAALAWGPAPAIFPAGAELSVVSGDPSKEGLYTVRLKMPDGYKIMPHWHPTDEHVTVISGTLNVAMGKEFDAAAGTAIPTGGYFLAPAKMAHYAWSSGPTVVQVHGKGPFQLTYINPKDDPSQPVSK